MQHSSGTNKINLMSYIIPSVGHLHKKVFKVYRAFMKAREAHGDRLITGD